jgi:hypothetical protein
LGLHFVLPCAKYDQDFEKRIVCRSPMRFETLLRLLRHKQFFVKLIYSRVKSILLDFKHSFLKTGIYIYFKIFYPKLISLLEQLSIKYSKAIFFAIDIDQCKGRKNCKNCMKKLFKDILNKQYNSRIFFPVKNRSFLYGKISDFARKFF